MSGCHSCRHHSKETRDRVVFEIGADEMEMLAEHDGSPEDVQRFGPQRTEDVYSCMKQGGKQIGIGEEAGAGCPMFEEGKRGGVSLPPHILARMEARARDEDL